MAERGPALPARELDPAGGRHDPAAAAQQLDVYRQADNFIDQYGDDWGVNFHADADWFIRQPWVLSTVFDYGNVGNAAVTHVRGTVGLMLDRWEVFAGYDYECVGTVPIRGPVAGVRVYF